LQARWDYIFINYNMYRRSINIKPKCGQQTGKALSNHERFSPSQSHETVPLRPDPELEARSGSEIIVLRQVLGGQFLFIKKYIKVNINRWVPVPMKRFML
jgi:hypothetical protein